MTTPGIVFLGVMILMAGIVRGYSGFGFSMIAVISLSLVLPPAQVVPVILLLEIVASVSLLPQVWREIDWPSLSWLSVGVVAGTPVGVYLLATVPPRPMRVAIAITVVILAVCLLRGFSQKKMPGRSGTVATGFVSGVLNGAATIGGPPVILFYFSSPAGMAVSRATLIAFFFGTDFFALGVCLLQGLMDVQTGIMGVACMVPMLIGVGAGSGLFKRTNIEGFRKKVLVLLILLSVLGLIRAIYGS
ncbi:MAG: sulfite exporter TauE/SafE family protein [Deltaproteobacteria bacterium]|nr:MAG: sulfite exporter TauE/SafE family protein [Deltaproteobacteria bacterium]